jgi:acyl-coenzyme A thioesterase PaaI-like protein
MAERIADRDLADFIEGVPANRTLQIRIEVMEDGHGLVRMPFQEHLGNHIGSHHVSPLFGLADAASAAALISGLGEMFASVTPMASGGDIEFKRIARGELVGECVFTPDEIDKIKSDLDTEGVSRPIAKVAIRDGDGTLCCEAQFRWHLKKRA